MMNLHFSTVRAASVLLVAAMIASCAGQAAPNLDATRWTLVELNGHAPLVDTSLTIGFEDGSVGGNSGCNSYGGIYKIEGSSIVISGLVSTLMACIEPVNGQEAEFLRALSEAASYEIAGGLLLLKDGSGSTGLLFRSG